MRILSITAGAAGMYCGSCARDNALARELTVQGHDVTLVPVYTPTRTDEPNACRPEVLFGGISVYLQHYVSLFRRTPRVLDRLWDSPWVINTLAGRAVSNDPSLLGGLTISMLVGENGALRKEFRKLIDWTRNEPRPDVVNLPNSLLISLAGPIRAALDCPVTCTLQGEELFIDGLVDPYREQALELIRGQVQEVDRFIAVSEYSAEFMAGYLQIPEDKISVVPLGINMKGYGRGRIRTTPDDEFRVGYFARVAPEKGLRLLVDAYVKFRQRTKGARVSFEAAGYNAPEHRDYLDRVRRTLNDAGLYDEFRYHGVLDRAEKLEFLQGLDALSVPATYDEPKGLFGVEAMANGVPVVQPRRGAFTEMVEKTQGGLLVEPDDADSLADGLYRLWENLAMTASMAQNAFENVRKHYTVERSATKLLATYESVLRDRSGANKTDGPVPLDRRTVASGL